MEPYVEMRVRVVTENVLDAMCERVSGVCRRYTIVRQTPNREYVQYSNPDEYGNEFPIDAHFPVYCVPGIGRHVVLDIVRTTGGSRMARETGWDWQCFDDLLDCPKLYRNPVDGTWRTAEEIKAQETAKAAN